MKQADGLLFTFDRNGNESTALDLNGTFTSVPPGVYFKSAFTISVWINPKEVGNWSRVIDFGNGENSDNVVLAITDGLSFKPTLHVYISNRYLLVVNSMEQIIQNNWQLLAATFDGANGKIYINGKLTGSASIQIQSLPRNIKRKYCFIGKSQWIQDDFSHSIISDLRIYNRCLSDDEILNLMKL